MAETHLVKINSCKCISLYYLYAKSLHVQGGVGFFCWGTMLPKAKIFWRQQSTLIFAYILFCYQSKFVTWHQIYLAWPFYIFLHMLLYNLLLITLFGMKSQRKLNLSQASTWDTSYFVDNIFFKEKFSSKQLTSVEIGMKILKSYK